MTSPGGAHARRLEGRTRALLAEQAGLVVPGDGLPVIRARIARRPWWRRVFSRRAMPRPYLMPAVEAVIADLKKKTAAPGASGTAAKPNDREESKDMSHDFIEERGPRGRQMAAALALAHLIEGGPAEIARWEVDDLGRLHGQVRRPGRDDKARAAIDAFAEFLSAPVKRSQGRNGHEEWVRLAVGAEYRGTPVRVWAHVDVRPVSPYASFGGAR